MEMNGEQQLDAGIGFAEQNSFFIVQNSPMYLCCLTGLSTIEWEAL